ncbi:MAG: hypothetical protein D6824_09410 [Planctomycetota bacterium]|nr:MAG: hypothetical protein D6824_09410 [Planctomycetota bacterium]
MRSHRLRLVEDEEPAPQPYPFPSQSVSPQRPKRETDDLAEQLEETIERMRRSLDELAEELDQVYRLPDPDDDPPAAA